LSADIEKRDCGSSIHEGAEVSGSHAEEILADFFESDWDDRTALADEAEPELDLPPLPPPRPSPR